MKNTGARVSPNLGLKAVIAALVGTLVLLYWWNPAYILRREVRWTVREVEQKVEEELRFGSMVGDVEVFFDKYHIQYTKASVNTGDTSVDWMKAARDAGLREDGFRKWIRGEILDAQADFLMRLNIYVYIFLDGEDKVVGKSVNDRVIGF